MLRKGSNFIDRTGKQYLYWSVIEFDVSKSSGRRSYWICKCICGVIKSVRSDRLERGSCGCIKAIILSKRTAKHMMSNTPLYKVWMGMKQRCSNKKNSRYNNYGGRGISICAEWMNFENFYNWSIENGYKKGLTLDRVDNNGDYTEYNCRYITNKKQQLNKSNNRIVTIDGESMSIHEWCTKYKINRNTFVWRLNNGWKGKELLNK
jgi:hypothetical protein